MSKNVCDLTRGPIASELVRYALPLLGSSIIQLMYSTVDLIFVGRIIGKEASAAVGASSLIVMCVLGFFTGLGVGVGVVTAKAVGREGDDEISRTVHCSAAIAVLLSLIFTVVGVAFAEDLLTWLNTPDEIMKMSLSYIRLYFLSLCSIVCYNIAAGIIRSIGDSKTPMWYQLAGGIANILGNTFFIYYLDLGVVGAALATAFSQTFAAILTVKKLCMLNGPARLYLTRIPRSFRWDETMQIFMIGIPAAIQSIMITLSNLVIQATINSLGVVSMAAFTAHFRAENLAYFPIMAMGQACSTFVSQNIGAHQLGRACDGTKTAVLTGLGVTVLTSAILTIFAPNVMAIFLKEQSVIETGVGIAMRVYPFYFLYVFVEVLASSMRGAGRALQIMGITLFNMLVLRICVLKAIMYISPSIYHVAFIYPITWACTSACLFAYYRSRLWVPKELIEIEHIDPKGAVGE